MEILLFGWMFFLCEEKFIQCGCQIYRNLGHTPNMCGKELYAFTVSLTHLGNVRLEEQIVCASWTSWVDSAQTEETGRKCPAEP